ncbi:MAG TPA: hypothetical protein DCZ94_11965 [Lentisphaeria bacterium]|nr:MAG: hypothetical protein A2X48_09440 [Lentisphaerae bacterium GWF2_49_21]HBC87664.1 hypothetical protein [Lentisphaeria bacterium]
MSEEKKIDFIDNPDFNRWIEENYKVEIEEYEYQSSDVLYKINYDDYLDALKRYNADPKIELTRIEDNFPSPIAYYFSQANNNYQNDHHRLDLLKSCWESIVFFLYGLVVAEARHRKIPLNSLGNRWDKYWSDKIFDKLTIIENIIDYTTKNGLKFDCSVLVPVATLSKIKSLNQERNGFEHSAARTSAQQMDLYKTLCPLLENVLKELINLEKVTVLRYYSSEIPLVPRCEIFNGSSLEGHKDNIILKKDNYIEILDHFNASSIFAKIGDEVFCLSPFIHFSQELHETNATLCFFKKEKSGKYLFEVVSKAKDIEFDKSNFSLIENKLKALVVP